MRIFQFQDDSICTSGLGNILNYFQNVYRMKQVFFYKRLHPLVLMLSFWYLLLLIFSAVCTFPFTHTHTKPLPMWLTKTKLRLILPLTSGFKVAICIRGLVQQSRSYGKWNTLIHYFTEIEKLTFLTIPCLNSSNCTQSKCYKNRKRKHKWTLIMET